jgi:hypothetical protein
MIVGFDYWNVISHNPEKIDFLMRAIELMMMSSYDTVYHVHVVSTIGKTRIGTVEARVNEVLAPYLHEDYYQVHEVVFKHAKESPELKLAKCKELGIEMFFDDRKDVVDLLNDNGILAFLVPRSTNLNDLGAELS